MEYADQNEMKINFKKTKTIVFNPCTSIDFLPEFALDNNEIEVVDELRLLGLIIRSDLKWVSNTEQIVKKANKRLWIIRRLKYLGAQRCVTYWMFTLNKFGVYWSWLYLPGTGVSP